ncbi:MAG: XRE family transcriptional regulator [Bacteroidales bacterium]|nr:XRE family transcriptional regulator [Bacteroidales bacterium]
MGKNKIIGERVRAMRESNELTREELAQRCGLDVLQVQNIEENTEIPSLAPLIKIARALGVRLGTFLDDQENLGPVVCRYNEQQPGMSFSNSNIQSRKHMTYNSLSNNKTGRHMEPFMINLAPKIDADFVLSSHEGEEFILVMDGSVEINYGEDTYTLSKGDSIYYDSIVPHIVRASDEQGARILAVIYTPV